MIEEGMVKVEFSFTDQFNEESRLMKTFNESVFIDQTTFEFLINEFKLFLHAAGFSQVLINKVQIAYEEE